MGFRVILTGQAAFGEKVLLALLERGVEVAAVFCPPDSTARPSPLRLAAVERGVAVHQPERMRSPSVVSAFRAIAPDLHVMAFVTDIVPATVLSAPRLGSIQYHPSLLPRHRGGSAINWAIIKGETRTGVTIFWPDSGIDTGPILLQTAVEIGPDDTTGSLYFGKLFPMGVDALAESVDLVRAGAAPRVPQDEALATSEPLCTEGLTAIDWTAPVSVVYNLIRGANPSPGAWTTFRGGRLKVLDSSLITADQPSLAAGVIVSIGAEGVAVQAEGGAILVRRVQPEGGAKLGASDFAGTSAMQVGEQLGPATGGLRA